MTTATSYTLARFAPTTSSLQCRTTRSTRFCQPSIPRPVTKSWRVCVYTGSAAEAWARLLGAQLDITTVANEEYITFSVSYVAEAETTITRVGLATRAFPGSQTAEDIEPWIEKASAKYKIQNTYDFACFVLACALRSSCTPHAVNVFALPIHSFFISCHSSTFSRPNSILRACN